MSLLATGGSKQSTLLSALLSADEGAKNEKETWGFGADPVFFLRVVVPARRLPRFPATPVLIILIFLFVQRPVSFPVKSKVQRTLELPEPTEEAHEKNSSVLKFPEFCTCFRPPEPARVFWLSSSNSFHFLPHLPESLDFSCQKWCPSRSLEATFCWTLPAEIVPVT